MEKREKNLSSQCAHATISGSININFIDMENITELIFNSHQLKCKCLLGGKKFYINVIIYLHKLTFMQRKCQPTSEIKYILPLWFYVVIRCSWGDWTSLLQHQSHHWMREQAGLYEFIWKTRKASYKSNLCSSPLPDWDSGSYFFMTGPGQGKLVFFFLATGTQDGLPYWQADEAVTGGRGVEMFRELAFVAQKISISENMRC